MARPSSTSACPGNRPWGRRRSCTVSRAETTPRLRSPIIGWTPPTSPTDREPDQYRWDLEAPSFDSYSGRLSYNPRQDWALQVSYGRVVSPEQLEPDVDTGRLTASASYNWRWAGSQGRTTFAFGQNHQKPGMTLNAFLLESALRLRAHTVFARWKHTQRGAGAVGSLHILPPSLKPDYGPLPASVMAFVRAKLI